MLRRHVSLDTLRRLRVKDHPEYVTQDVAIPALSDEDLEKALHNSLRDFGDNSLIEKLVDEALRRMKDRVR